MWKKNKNEDIDNLDLNESEEYMDEVPGDYWEALSGEAKETEEEMLQEVSEIADETQDVTEAADETQEISEVQAESVVKSETYAPQQETVVGEEPVESQPEPEHSVPKSVIAKSEQAKLTDVVFSDEHKEKEGDKAPVGLKVVGIVALIAAIAGLALMGLCIYFMIFSPNYDKSKEEKTSTYSRIDAVMTPGMEEPRPELEMIVVDTEETTEVTEENTTETDASTEEGESGDTDSDESYDNTDDADYYSDDEYYDSDNSSDDDSSYDESTDDGSDE